MSTELILRTCNTNMTSRNGFQWPTSGLVAAPDWSPEPVCGHGLHGLLRGEGEGRLLSWDDAAVWLVVAVETATVIDLGGKVKFPRGIVIYAGDRAMATAMISARYPSAAVVGGMAVAGDHATVTVGYRGTATAGDGGTATAGDGGTATAGDGGTATAGYRGTATAGYRGTATAGDGGTATAGDRGTATAGDYGEAAAGDGGTATAGDGGTATAGDGGTATAGDCGTIVIGYMPDDRRRLAVGYVGECGIEAGVAYCLDDDGEFVRADAAPALSG